MLKNKKENNGSRDPVLLPLVEKGRNLLSNFENAAGAWVGSWNCMIFHILWFLIWILEGKELDTLLLIINFEAIFLMILLLMVENKKEKRDREDELQRYRYILRSVQFSNKTDAAVRSMTEIITKKIDSIENRIKNIENKKGLYL